MRARVCLALIVACSALVPSGAARAQTPAPAPAAAACVSPNAPAQVTTAAPPVTPPIALQQGISGTVLVAITLDADSHVRSAVITQSPSFLLDSSALAAVQKSVFSTRIVNCVPMASALVYPVVFAPVATHGQLPDMSAYFIGTWYCATGQGAQVVQTFGRPAYDSPVLVFANAYVNADKTLSNSIQRFSELNGVTTVTGDFQGRLFIGTSHGWNGNALTFVGDNTVPQQAIPPPLTAGPLALRMTLTKSDANHFEHLFESAASPDGPWTAVSKSSCARIVTPEGS